MYSELFIRIEAEGNGPEANVRHIYSGDTVFGSKRSQNSKLRWWIISICITAIVRADMLVSAIMRRQVVCYTVELDLYHHETGKPTTRHVTTLFKTSKGWYRFDAPLDLED